MVDEERLYTWDAFVSHASEDKEVARSLVAELQGRGLRVWFDELELGIGDSIRQRIEHGLAQSRCGILIVSETFLNKPWPRQEVDGLVSLETSDGRSRILPVWHRVNYQEVAAQAPMLASRRAGLTSEPLPKLAIQLVAAIGSSNSIIARLPLVALSAELETCEPSRVVLTVRNLGPIHAHRVTFEPRKVEGRGVPLTPAQLDSVRASEDRRVELRRFVGRDPGAAALYDFLYTDPTEQILKRQRLKFSLYPDVVTGRENQTLVPELTGPEESFSASDLEPWPDFAEDIVQAWLFSQEWLLTGSTTYVRALRALDVECS